MVKLPEPTGYSCIHCGSADVRKKGFYKGTQRLKCHGCGKSFCVGIDPELIEAARNRPRERCYHCGSMETSKGGFSRFGERVKQRYLCRSCGRFFRENVEQRETEKKTTPPPRRTLNLPSAGHLILELKAYAQQLGRTPTVYDIAKRARGRRGNSLDTYRAVFGSYREATARAKLTPNHIRRYSPERMLAELRALREKLGRALITSDIEKASEKGIAPAPHLLRRAFGSVRAAFAAAGVGRKTYDRKEMIGALRQLDATLDHPITFADISAAYIRGEGPSVNAVEREFGGIRSVIVGAGLKRPPSKPPKPPKKRKRIYTEERMLADLIKLRAKLGRPPTRSDIRQAAKEGVCAFPERYRRTFGGLLEAYAAAGIQHLGDTGQVRQYTDEELLAYIEMLVKELGRFPGDDDLREASKAGRRPSANTITRYLGKLPDIRRKYFPDSAKLKRPSKYSEEDLVAAIRSLAKELGRFPVDRDLRAASRAGKCPGPKVFYRNLGTLREIRIRFFPELDPGRPHVTYTDEELIGYIRRFVKENQRFPEYVDLEQASRAGKGPDASTFRNRFGALSEIRRRYFPEVKVSKYARKYTEDEIITAVRKLAYKLGRFPLGIEIEEASRKGKCPSTNAIRRKFGSVAALRSIHFPDLDRTGRRRSPDHSDEYLLGQLRQLVSELGRFPLRDEIRAASRAGRCPSTSTFEKRFGRLSDIRRKYFPEL